MPSYAYDQMIAQRFLKLAHRYFLCQKLKLFQLLQLQAQFYTNSTLWPQKERSKSNDFSDIFHLTDQSKVLLHVPG
jgi:hypothetical protein